jgi:hypothetical protein
MKHEISGLNGVERADFWLPEKFTTQVVFAFSYRIRGNDM